MQKVECDVEGASGTVTTGDRKLKLATYCRRSEVTSAPLFGHKAPDVR
jgi:hypothetical protein